LRSTYLIETLRLEGKSEVERDHAGGMFARRRPTMNWDQVAGNWKQLRGTVREKWGQLTDDDLDQIAGRRDQLVGKL
jgi:hypothetical protein